MNRDLLKDCVGALKALRAAKHEELSASVAAELDAVICQLELCRKKANDEAVDAELKLRALEILSRCVMTATNLAELIRKYFGPE